MSSSYAGVPVMPSGSMLPQGSALRGTGVPRCRFHRTCAVPRAAGRRRCCSRSPRRPGGRRPAAGRRRRRRALPQARLQRRRQRVAPRDARALVVAVVGRPVAAAERRQRKPPCGAAAEAAGWSSTASAAWERGRCRCWHAGQRGGADGKNDDGGAHHRSLPLGDNGRMARIERRQEGPGAQRRDPLRDVQRVPRADATRRAAGAGGGRGRCPARAAGREGRA